jgi:hypothetical protein
MKRYLVFLFVLCFLPLSLIGEGKKLSSMAQVSIVTIAPGEELYSCFGHNAIRIQDEGIDRVYNYGTFDFDEPGFYVKFTRGQLDYMLSVSGMERMLRNAQWENRTVTEQWLNFSLEQKQAIYDFLEWNYRPENRYYKYDFFLDNCATRIRDVLVNVLGNDLLIGTPGIYDPQNTLSFRQLIDLYLKEKPLEDLGMDIGLGLPADRKATAYEYMFLPDFLKDAIERSYIFYDDQKHPLVRDHRVLYQAREIHAHHSILSPEKGLWVILVLVLVFTFKSWKNPPKKHRTFGDTLLFFFTGMIGLLLVLLWFATDHKVTAYNYDLLWAWPFHLVVAVLYRMGKKPGWLRKYFLAYGAVILLVLVCWKVIPQDLNADIVPFLLILAIRAFYIAKPFPNGSGLKNYKLAFGKKSLNL